MSKKGQETKQSEAGEFVDHFIEFISDCSDLSDEELEVELKQDGVHIDDLVENVQRMVNNVVDGSRLAWQKEAGASRSVNVKRFVGKTVEMVRLSKNELLDRIRAIVSAQDPDFSFAHRNLRLEDMSEEELREILNEYEQLGHGE